MFKNYLTTAINNLFGNKLYSGINIAGLAFGLAASILIALYVLDETSYDKHWKNADRIYRVNTSFWSTGGAFSLGAATTGLVIDRKSTRLNSSHSQISYAVFCLK